MGDAATWVGVVISGVSLIVSILALWKSAIAQREANVSQQRIVAIEEQRENDRLAVSRRAELRAELRRTARHTDRLYIMNEGLAEARNVAVVLEGRPLLEHAVGGPGVELASTIGPKSEVSCILMTSMECKPPFDIHVTWEDDLGKSGSYRSTLTR